MATSRGNLKCPASLRLTFDVRQIWITIPVQKIRLFRSRERIVTHEVVAYLPQGMCYPYRGTFCQRRFATGGLRPKPVPVRHESGVGCL